MATGLSTLIYGGSAAAMLAVGQFVGQVPGSMPTDLFQFGALGLCGFMVWRNYKAQESGEKARMKLGSIIDEQHREFVRLAAQTIETIQKNTSAMDACVAKQKRAP